MLIKVQSDNIEKLVILDKNNFEEFVEKAKNALQIESDIIVEYSGCIIDAQLFLELLSSFEKNKELITFIITIDKEGEQVAQMVQEEAPEPQVDDHYEEVCDEPTTRLSREVTVNPNIVAIKFEEIFELAKIMGSISTGHKLVKKDRLLVSKAVIRKILSDLGLDYKIQKPDFVFISKKLETLLNDPEGIYYIPAKGGCAARGFLYIEYYAERTDLAKRNVITRRSKIRRIAIDAELTAAGNSNYQDVVRLFDECGGDWLEIKEIWNE
ncbi:hypothetical protein ACFFRR_006812 [Megaselia abdita]